MIFGRKREEGTTILILDVESGSVGGALARFAEGEQPRVFGETRRLVPLQVTHDINTLARHTLDAAERTLAHVAEVAARVREHLSLAPAGNVAQAVIFLSPPWGALTIADRVLGPHPLLARLQKILEAFFGPISITTEPFGLMAAHTAPLIFPHDEHSLLSTVSGDVTELILLEHVGSHLKVAAHASLPIGHHYPLRTLLSHGKFSEAEARSALRLSARGHAPTHALEALHAASAHLANEFGTVAGELLAHAPARRLLVVGGEPGGEWFARSLAGSPAMAEVFSSTGEVRALRPQHATPYVAVHAPRPDLPLLLETMFVNTRFNSGL